MMSLQYENCNTVGHYNAFQENPNGLVCITTPTYAYFRNFRYAVELICVLNNELKVNYPDHYQNNGQHIIKRLLVSLCQEETDCYWGDIIGLIKIVHICMLVTKISFLL